MNRLFILCIFILVGCAESYEPHVFFANKVSMEFANKLKSNDGLRPCGFGGAMVGDIQEIELGFETDQCMALDEMRRFIVYKAEEFLTTINNNLEIRPYLHNYPFTIDNICISIGYEKKGKHNVFYPHVYSAQIVSGKILYLTFANESDWFFTEPKSEPYTEALRMVYDKSMINSECID